MFTHLDDPTPPSPTSRTLHAVLRRAARLRRHRTTSTMGALGVTTLVVGVVIGMLVPRSASVPADTAAFSVRGILPPGTPVPQSDLADVVFVDRLHGFALAVHGAQSVLAASGDGGERWTVVAGSLPVAVPAQLEFADLDHGYLWGGAPGATGTAGLWRTSDGGASWQEASPGPVVSDVSAIGPDVWAVVGTCPLSARVPAPACPVSLEVSTDAGATWTPAPARPPVSEDAGLSLSDQDIELARITTARTYVLSFAPSGAPAASAGRLVYTADGGTTWQTRTDPCPAYFGFGQQVAASGTDDLWMLCASQASSGSQAKALYRSVDGGRSWSLASAANAPVLSGGVTVPAGGGLPAGGYLAPYSLGHDTLAIVSPHDAWLFPDGAAVFATADGGRTWATVAGLAEAGLVVGGSGNVVFVDATHGWVCETGAGLWRTTDGTTWTRLGP